MRAHSKCLLASLACGSYSGLALTSPAHHGWLQAYWSLNEVSRELEDPYSFGGWGPCSLCACKHRCRAPLVCG